MLLSLGGAGGGGGDSVLNECRGEGILAESGDTGLSAGRSSGAVVARVGEGAGGEFAVFGRGGTMASIKGVVDCVSRAVLDLDRVSDCCRT